MYPLTIGDRFPLAQFGDLTEEVICRESNAFEIFKYASIKVQ